MGSGMQFGPAGNKMTDKTSKGSFGAHEFIPGQMWTGNKDYANDPDVTPASVNTWQSAVNERDVINLQVRVFKFYPLSAWNFLIFPPLLGNQPITAKFTEA